MQSLEPYIRLLHQNVPKSAKAGATDAEFLMLNSSSGSSSLNETLENFCTAIAVLESNTLRGNVAVVFLRDLRQVLAACFYINPTGGCCSSSSGTSSSVWSKARTTAVVLALRASHLLSDVSAGFEVGDDDVCEQIHALAVLAIKSGIPDVIEEGAKYVTVEIVRSWDGMNKEGVGNLIQAIVSVSAGSVMMNAMSSPTASSAYEALFYLASLVVGIAYPLHPIAVEKLVAPWMLQHLRFAAHFNEHTYNNNSNNSNSFANASFASPLSSPTFGNNNHHASSDQSSSHVIRWSTLEQLLLFVQSFHHITSRSTRDVFSASMADPSSSDHSSSSSSSSLIISILSEVPSLLAVLTLKWATHDQPARTNCIISALSSFAGSFSGDLRVAACEAVMDAGFLHWFEKTLLKETEVPVLSVDIISPSVSSMANSPQQSNNSLAGSPVTKNNVAAVLGSDSGSATASPTSLSPQKQQQQQQFSPTSTASQSPLSSPSTTVVPHNNHNNQGHNTHHHHHHHHIDPNGPPSDSPFATRSELQLVWNSLDDPFGTASSSTTTTNGTATASSSSHNPAGSSSSSSHSQLRRSSAAGGGMGEPQDGPPPVETALLYLISQLLPHVVERATVLFHIVPVHSYTIRYLGMTKDIQISSTLATEMESYMSSGLDRFIVSLRSETCYADLCSMRVTGAAFEQYGQSLWTPLRFTKLCPLRYSVAVDRGSLDHANALDAQQQQQMMRTSSSSNSHSNDPHHNDSFTNPVARRLQVQHRIRQRIEVETNEDYQMTTLSLITTYLPIVLNYFNFARSDVQRTLITCCVSQLFKGKLRSNPFVRPVLETLKDNFLQFFSDSFTLVENLLSIDRLLMACEGFCEFFSEDVFSMVQRGISDQIFALSRRLGEKLEQVRTSLNNTDFMPSSSRSRFSLHNQSNNNSSTTSVAMQQCEGVLARCYSVLIRLRQSQQQELMKQQQQQQKENTNDENNNTNKSENNNRANDDDDDQQQQHQTAATSSQNPRVLARALFSSSSSASCGLSSLTSSSCSLASRKIVSDLKSKLDELNIINSITIPATASRAETSSSPTSRDNSQERSEQEEYESSSSPNAPVVTHQQQLKRQEELLTDIFGLLTTDDAQSLTNLELADSGVISSLISFIVPQIPTFPLTPAEQHLLRTVRTKKRIETFALIYGESQQQRQQHQGERNNNATSLTQNENTVESSSPLTTPQKNNNNNSSSVFKRKPLKDRNVLVEFLAYEIDVYARSVRDRVPLVRKVFVDAEIDNAEATSMFGEDNTDGYVTEQAVIEGHCRSLRGTMEAALSSGAMFVGLAPEIQNIHAPGNRGVIDVVVGGSEDEYDNASKKKSNANNGGGSRKKHARTNSSSPTNQSRSRAGTNTVTASVALTGTLSTSRNDNENAHNENENYNDDSSDHQHQQRQTSSQQQQRSSMMGVPAPSSTPTFPTNTSGLSSADDVSSSASASNSTSVTRSSTISSNDDEDDDDVDDEDDDDDDDDDDYFSDSSRNNNNSNYRNNNAVTNRDLEPLHLAQPDKYLSVHWLASIGTCLTHLEKENYDHRNAIEASDPGAKIRARNESNKRTHQQQQQQKDNKTSSDESGTVPTVDPVSCALEYLNQAKEDSALSHLSLARAQHWSALDQLKSRQEEQRQSSPSPINNRSSLEKKSNASTNVSTSNSKQQKPSSPTSVSSSSTSSPSHSRFEFSPPCYVVEDIHHQPSNQNKQSSSNLLTSSSSGSKQLQQNRKTTRVYRFEPAHAIAVKSGFAPKRFSEELTIRETKLGSSRVQSLTFQIALDRGYSNLPERNLGLVSDHALYQNGRYNRNAATASTAAEPSSPIGSPAVALLRLLHTHGHLPQVPHCDVIDELALRTASASALVIAQNPTTLSCLPQWLADLIVYTPILLSSHTRRRLAKFFLIGARRSFAKGLVASRLNADRVLFDVVPVDVSVDESTAESAAESSAYSSSSSHRHHHSTSTSSNRLQGHVTRQVRRVLRWPSTTSISTSTTPLTVSNVQSSESENNKKFSLASRGGNHLDSSSEDDDDDDDDDGLGLIPTAKKAKMMSSSPSSFSRAPQKEEQVDPFAWLDSEVSCEAAIMQSAGDLLPASLAFEGDVGTGVGPSFQVLACVAESLATNQISKIWRKTRESSSSSSSSSSFLLFPQAVRRDDPISIGRLRLVGAALARAWCDDRIFPLPLDPALFEAMQGVVATGMELSRRTSFTSSSYSILNQICPEGLVKTLQTLQNLAATAIQLCEDVLPEIMNDEDNTGSAAALRGILQSRNPFFGEDVIKLCFDRVLEKEEKEEKGAKQKQQNATTLTAHEIKSTLESLWLSNCVPCADDVPVVGLDLDLELEVQHLPRYLSVMHEAITGLKLPYSALGMEFSGTATTSNNTTSSSNNNNSNNNHQRFGSGRFSSSSSPNNSPVNYSRGFRGTCHNNESIASNSNSSNQNSADPYSASRFFYPFGARSVENIDVISGVHLVLDGFAEIAPLWPLLLQTPHELCKEICGSSSHQVDSSSSSWSPQQVLSILVPDHGYNSQSCQIKWLAEVIAEFSSTNNSNTSTSSSFSVRSSLRSKLLSFITGCPVLPAGGLDAVGPVKVVMKISNTLAASSSLFNNSNSSGSFSSFSPLSSNNNQSNNDENEEVILTTPPKALRPKVVINLDDDEDETDSRKLSNADQQQQQQTQKQQDDSEKLFIDEIRDLGLPSVNTCVRYLKLPPYSRKEFLEKALKLAITDGNEGFELS